MVGKQMVAAHFERDGAEIQGGARQEAGAGPGDDPMLDVASAPCRIPAAFMAPPSTPTQGTSRSHAAGVRAKAHPSARTTPRRQRCPARPHGEAARPRDLHREAHRRPPALVDRPARRRGPLRGAAAALTAIAAALYAPKSQPPGAGARSLGEGSPGADSP